jgi:hypothetical protein
MSCDLQKPYMDFKFSQSWSRKAIVELKLAKNSRYWPGIRSQVVKYVKAEDVPCGFFLSIQFTKNDLEKVRTDRLNDAAKQASNDSGRTIKSKLVDARPQKPASKL